MDYETNEDGKVVAVYWIRNPETGKYERTDAMWNNYTWSSNTGYSTGSTWTNTWSKNIDITWTSTEASINNPQTIADYSTTKRWTTNLQCWQLVNDYVQKITWTKWWLWDDYSTKVQAIKNIWQSNAPQAWWIFAFPLKDNPYW
jgi:hypothetical protein